MTLNTYEIRPGYNSEDTRAAVRAIFASAHRRSPPECASPETCSECGVWCEATGQTIQQEMED